MTHLASVDGLSLQALDLSDLSKPQATVVITTRNRKEDLRLALASCLTQDVPVDLLVIDDASTDGTADMVRSEFPRVRLERSEFGLGLIVQRNRAAAMVRTPIIISIDDDAIFTTPCIIRQTLRAFDHRRIGAVAIPFVNVNESPKILQRAPDAAGTYIAAVYIGTAHALRLDLFKQLQGYRGFFFSQFEEHDYCLRMMDAGYFVRLGCGDVIHHMQSPRRLRKQIVMYGERNQVLITVLNFPWRFVLRSVAAQSWQAVDRARRNGLGFWGAIGLLRGCVESLRYLRYRHAVSIQTYQRLRMIYKRGGFVRADELGMKERQHA